MVFQLNLSKGKDKKVSRDGFLKLDYQLMAVTFSSA